MTGIISLKLFNATVIVVLALNKSMTIATSVVFALYNLTSIFIVPPHNFCLIKLI
ncbi:hypothetical protein [Methanosphaera sp. WGK6]|uniref:hypothetical protein n=1 Tax=Methanosphaera sp. WGK6 TaxID=1561964 RepID=UPI001F518E14|nr:hypothetical protein [Methanosphaera sp. WGK6]